VKVKGDHWSRFCFLKLFSEISENLENLVDELLLALRGTDFTLFFRKLSEIPMVNHVCTFLHPKF
jgi:hypothetical protein